MKDQHPVWIFIGGWVELAEALTCIFSLGFFNPWWMVRFRLWKLNYLYKET